jgi:hypothetical protein
VLPVGSDAGNVFVDRSNASGRMSLITAGETNGADLNFAFNQTFDTVTQPASLCFAAGDGNAGLDPPIVGNAYRDAVASGGVGATPPPEGDVQLAIDAATDALVQVAGSPGELSTLAGFDATGAGGFDILSRPIVRGAPPMSVTPCCVGCRARVSRARASASSSSCSLRTCRAASR